MSLWVDLDTDRLLRANLQALLPLADPIRPGNPVFLARTDSVGVLFAPDNNIPLPDLRLIAPDPL